jgi:hypothetical protein
LSWLVFSIVELCHVWVIENPELVLLVRIKVLIKSISWELDGHSYAGPKERKNRAILCLVAAGSA